MKPLTAKDPETKSADVLAGNIKHLKTLFPEAFTEGKIDFEVLKQLLGGMVDEREEKYGLNWHGKRRARQLALTPSTGTLRPCPEDSVDWDNTQNLMIEGDNLEVLKLLQKSYAGKVKLIYIDPPYNTGKDFVYPDNFQDNIKNYLELTGQTGEGGKKLSSNTEASGRFHTDWLNMMYPRLKLARNLLTDDGFLFISIDHNELASLKSACDEILGGENFRNLIIVRRGVKNVQAQFETISNLSSGHEYLLCYSSNADHRFPKLSHDIEGNQAGKWDTFWRGTDRHTLRYELFGKTPETGQWRWSQERALSAAQNYTAFLNDSNNSLSLDDYYLDHLQSTNIELDFARLNDDGVVQYYVPPRDYKLISDNWMDVSIKGSEIGFDTEKHVQLMTRIIKWMTCSSDIVLDFFAGSGTTGHAVLAQNAADSSKRRYIIVQLPARVDPENKDQKSAADFCDTLNKPRTIAELTKERLRRAGKKIKEENLMFAGDLGFRVFKLASSNIRAWEPDRDKLAETLEASIEHLKTDRTEQDILFELLLKLGLDLCVPIEQKKIAGKQVHSIGGGTLIVCLNESIIKKEVELLAMGIIAWHKHLTPAGETTVVFRDSAFADDVTKTNLTAILQQHGLEKVRSL
jgi:adenine-specific DNA-methyltransferase